jgi:hypothetical protein
VGVQAVADLGEVGVLLGADDQRQYWCFLGAGEGGAGGVDAGVGADLVGEGLRRGAGGQIGAAVGGVAFQPPGV